MTKSTVISFIAIVLSILSLCLSSGVIDYPTKSHILWLGSVSSHYRVPDARLAISVSDKWGYNCTVFYNTKNQDLIDLGRVTVLGGDAENEPLHRKTFTKEDVPIEIWKMWQNRYIFARSKVNKDNNHYVQWDLQSIFD